MFHYISLYIINVINLLFRYFIMYLIKLSSIPDLILHSRYEQNMLRNKRQNIYNVTVIREWVDF